MAIIRILLLTASTMQARCLLSERTCARVKRETIRGDRSEFHEREKLARMQIAQVVRLQQHLSACINVY